MKRDENGPQDRVRALGRAFVGEGGELTYSGVMNLLAIAQTK
jgi:hypothetical protein